MCLGPEALGRRPPRPDRRFPGSGREEHGSDSAATIEAADALELIVRAGAGTNTIDVDAASEVGIYVTNVPGRNAIAVAELTMGLLLAIDRRIADNVADLRTGSWNKADYSKADGLFGKVIGIVGLGEIGLAVAERATAFGLEVRAIRKDRDEAVEERITGARHRARGLPRGARGLVRHRHRPRSRHARDRVDVRRPAARSDEGRRDPPEHVSRRHRGRERRSWMPRHTRAPRGSRRVSR